MKVLKVIAVIFFVLVLGITGLLTFVKTALPNVGPPPDLTIERTPERIARGRYLANSVAVCMDCHSTRDWAKFSARLVPGTYGQGGEEFSQKFGFPGEYYSKNITPAGIGEWTDGEVFRAITSGVSKDGSPLFPVMPHPNYGKLDKEDIYSIIAYVRTLDPIKNEVKKSSSDFPMNFIIHTIPQPASFSTIPDKSDKLAYGKYLLTAASCGECHTKQDKGAPIAGMEYAGGFEFPIPSGGVVRSLNITPDQETGIGSWTEDAFVKRFKAYTDSSYSTPVIEKGMFNSVMPWMMYSTMEEDDLRALYTYLRTLPAINNKVERFTAPN